MNLIAGQSADLAKPATAAPHLSEVLAMTRELFPRHVKVCKKEDPEISDEEYVVLYVSASGSAEEIVARHVDWHRRIIEVAPDVPGLFRLAIDVE